jgi:2-oxoisovalerate dehydrogenase E1 component alpha subunit
LGYAIPSLRVDGNDFLAVFAVTRWAAERARANLGPTLIEHFTYRASAHSTSDDPSRYRPLEEASAWPLGDPVERLKAHMITIGVWSEEQHAALEKEAAEAVKQATKAADKIGALGQSRPHPDTMFEDVFADLPWHLEAQRQEALGQ